MGINNDEVDKLLGQDGNQNPQNPDNGSNITPGQPGGNGGQTDNIFEVNGQKYDLSKPEDVTRWKTDYENLEKEKSRLANDNHKLKTQTANQNPQTPPDKGNKGNQDQVDVDKLVDEKLATREYWKEVDKQINAISQEYGVSRDEVIKQFDETGVYFKPDDMKPFWEGKNPDKVATKRQQEIERNRPTVPYTQSSGGGGFGQESSESEVIRFGTNVTDKALELLNGGE